MSLHLKGRIEIIRGDITTLDVDMIVNAANGALCGGGGVDGDIHDAAGPGLLDECLALKGARPGEVKVTGGHSLTARFIAHAVGPVWQGGDKGEDALLETCYRRSLEVAVERCLGTVAFPSISTGAFRFPIERAARIAQSTVRMFLDTNSTLKQVTFCCFDAADERIYRKVARSRLDGL
jgi:O-acetyl-ADP-ribose deacetylase (regulator of RNase III)